MATFSIGISMSLHLQLTDCCKKCRSWPIMLLNSAQRNNPLYLATAISFYIELSNYLMPGCNVQYQEFMIIAVVC